MNNFHVTQFRMLFSVQVGTSNDSLFGSLKANKKFSSNYNIFYYLLPRVLGFSNEYVFLFPLIVRFFSFLFPSFSQSFSQDNTKGLPAWSQVGNWTTFLQQPACFRPFRECLVFLNRCIGKHAQAVLASKFLFKMHPEFLPEAP